MFPDHCDNHHPSCGCGSRDDSASPSFRLLGAIPCPPVFSLLEFRGVREAKVQRYEREPHQLFRRHDTHTCGGGKVGYMYVQYGSVGATYEAYQYVLSEVGPAETVGIARIPWGDVRQKTWGRDEEEMVRGGRVMREGEEDERPREKSHMVHTPREPTALRSLRWVKEAQSYSPPEPTRLRSLRWAREDQD